MAIETEGITVQRDLLGSIRVAHRRAVCVCARVYECVHASLGTCMRVCAGVHVYMSACAYGHSYVHICVRVYAHAHACAYIEQLYLSKI